MPARPVRTARTLRRLSATAAVSVLTLLGAGLLGSPAQAAAATCNGLTVTVNGTNGNDTLTGTAGNDVIAGGNGNDTIDGGAGNDVICGGNGQDVIRGGAGNDTIVGDNDNDKLYGEAGDDTISAGNGDDLLDGGAGNDALKANNGDDTLLGGPGTDSAAGENGVDRCVDSESTTGCETIETSEPVSNDPLTEQGPAPPGEVPVDGPDGVRLVIQSAGGITPWDVQIATDDVTASSVADALASPVYQFTLPPGASMTSAALTIPYDLTVLDGFPEADLRLYYMDDTLGLWLPAEGDQVVDTTAHTVSTTVTHFSSYGVFKLDERGFERYWPTKQTYCLQSGDASQVGVDVAFVIDVSGSMGWNDPSSMRVAGAKAFLDQMRPVDAASVVSFESYAYTQIPLTTLATTQNRADVVAALDRSGYAGGGTNIAAGVSQGLFELEASPGVGRAKVLVLMTDGDSSYADYLTQTARDQGVVIDTIGLGDGVQSTLLQSIADGTGGQFLALTDASQLPALYASLGKGLIDDGTDTDQDGLTDCEETYGVLTSYGFYDTSNTSDPFAGNRRVVSDPNKVDTDGDRLTDGEELRGKPMGKPLDLRDYAATRTTYKFLIDAGITKYFVGRSLPTVVDSDEDTVSDYDETVGTMVGGVRYYSRADRKDTDFDLATDDLEYQRGTDPRQPDRNELNIPGLAPYTLFQPQKYTNAGLAPVILQRAAIANNTVSFRSYARDVVTYDGSWNCVSNCSALIDAAPGVAASNCSWWPWASPCDLDSQVRTLVKRAVEAQRIFTASGDFLGTFTAEQAAAQCAVESMTATCKDTARFKDVPSSVPLDDPAQSDGPRNDNLDAQIAQVLLNVPGGYRPKDLCSKSGVAGVYELVDTATQVVVYVGETNDFERRKAEHKANPKFKDLEFRQVYEADNRNVRRGLEQDLFNQHWGDVDIRTAQAQGSLNGQRPMSKINPAKVLRAKLVNLWKTTC